MGVTVTFSDVVLGTVGQQPGISGTVTLPTGRARHFSQVLMPAPSPTDGFMITVTGKGPGAQVGSTPWRYGIGQTGAMLDLHTSMDYDLMRPDGRTAMARAYAAYDEVASPTRRTPAARGWASSTSTARRAWPAPRWTAATSPSRATSPGPRRA